MAEQMIAYCGLVCTDCPAFIATQKNDPDALRQVAEKWSVEFGVPMTAESCICDGCTADGRKIAHCSECGVRACAVGRGVANCAYCDDYGCETVTQFWKMAPDAKKTLDGIRQSLQ